MRLEHEVLQQAAPPQGHDGKARGREDTRLARARIARQVQRLLQQERLLLRTGRACRALKMGASASCPDAVLMSAPRTAPPTADLPHLVKARQQVHGVSRLGCLNGILHAHARQLVRVDQPLGKVPQPPAHCRAAGTSISAPWATKQRPRESSSRSCAVAPVVPCSDCRTVATRPPRIVSRTRPPCIVPEVAETLAEGQQRAHPSSQSAGQHPAASLSAAALHRADPSAVF